jgi:hypothetical protein
MRSGLYKYKGEINIDKRRSCVAARYFSSLPPFTPDYPNNLYINSTLDDIIFENGKSVLIMPSLNLFEKYIKIEMDIGGKLHEIELGFGYSNFMKVLDMVMKNLPEGCYSFEFYFYIDASSLPESKYIFNNVYTFDPFDKNCLIRMHMCSYGFKNLFRESIELTDGNRTSQLLYIGEKLQKTFVYLKSPDMEQV